MSTKQMARAGFDGSRLSFHFDREDVLNGYLVGMDDYHWLVASVSHPNDGREQTVETHLVHKGSVARVRIHKHALLTQEPEPIKAEVESIGGAFFAFCAGLLARKTPEQQN